MKNEKETFINGLSNYKILFSFNRDLAHKDLIAKLLFDSSQFESPDSYLIIDKCVYIIEYFSFDCSKRTKKGSNNLRAKGKSLNDVENLLSKVMALKGIPDTANEILLNTNYYQEGSIQYYIDSFLSSFEEHYAKIVDYRNNLISHNPELNNYEFKAAFLAIDLTIFPRFFNQTFATEYFPLLPSKEFNTFYREHRDVDFVMIRHMYSKAPIVSFISRDSVDESPTFDLNDGNLIIPNLINIRKKK